MKIDISRAKCAIIVSNYQKNPHYTPYCGRCTRIVRMSLVAPFLWKHDCGAIHDERQVIVDP